MEVRTEVNSLFGKFTSAANTGVISWVSTASTDSAISDYITRDMGITKTIKKNNKALEAINNVGIYISNRGGQIKTMIDDAKDEFKKIYKEALESGLSQKEAQKMAEESAKDLVNRKYKILNEEWPVQLAERKTGKLSK